MVTRAAAEILVGSDTSNSSAQEWFDQGVLGQLWWPWPREAQSASVFCHAQVPCVVPSRALPDSAQGTCKAVVHGTYTRHFGVCPSSGVFSVFLQHYQTRMYGLLIHNCFLQWKRTNFCKLQVSSLRRFAFVTLWWLQNRAARLSYGHHRLPLPPLPVSAQRHNLSLRHS